MRCKKSEVDRVMVTFEEIQNGRQKATKSKSISLLNTSTCMNIILCLLCLSFVVYLEGTSV